MKDIVKSVKCSGCAACYNICPKNAIDMRQDERGFLVPIINKDKCVECGLCKKVCPILQKSESNPPTKKAYVAKNSMDIRKNSSSGGIFSFLASKIIDKNGVVYGARFEKDLSIIHDRAENIEEIKAFCGSKYSQSEVKNSYKNVYEDLSKGREVLYSGCPCQIAGLKSYLEQRKCSTEKLYTQDFICHGVASPRFYRDYVKFYESKYKSRAISINFRGKPKLGKFQNMIINFENGKSFTAISTNQDIFYYHFLNNLVLRESCYNCNYANIRRVSDITLADCFSVKEDLQEFDDKRGLSFVMINSEKGEELFQNAERMLQIRAVNIADYMQSNMQQPSEKPKSYDSFWNEYLEKGFLTAIKKHGNYNVKNMVKKFVIYLINILGIEGWIKKMLKK